MVGALFRAQPKCGRKRRAERRAGQRGGQRERLAAPTHHSQPDQLVAVGAAGNPPAQRQVRDGEQIPDTTTTGRDGVGKRKPAGLQRKIAAAQTV